MKLTINGCACECDSVNLVLRHTNPDQLYGMIERILYAIQNGGGRMICRGPMKCIRNTTDQSEYSVDITYGD